MTESNGMKIMKNLRHANIGKGRLSLLVKSTDRGLDFIPLNLDEVSISYYDLQRFTNGSEINFQKEVKELAKREGQCEISLLLEDVKEEFVFPDDSVLIVDKYELLEWVDELKKYNPETGEYEVYDEAVHGKPLF